MTVTAASFRATFPVFASTTTYPDPQVQLWLSVAVQQVNAERWGTLTDMGVSLYVAHQLVLEQKASMGASSGAPGSTVGILSSKSVDGVSASYDVSASTEKDAGHWNLTTYGTRYWRFSKMMGAGPMQIGYNDLAGNSVVWQGPTH